MLTDPVGDMLTRIRNANKAMHDTAEMPTSRLKAEIARLLKEEGYISDYRVERKPDEKGAEEECRRAQLERGGDPLARRACPQERARRESFRELDH